MSEEVYNIKDTNVIINGIFMTGYSDDSKVSIEKNEDDISTYVDTDGNVTYAEQTDESGTMTVSLNQTSPSLPFLSKLRKSKKTFPVSIIDSNTGRYKNGGNKCRIVKMPDREWGKEIAGVEVQVFIPKLNEEMEG